MKRYFKYLFSLSLSVGMLSSLEGNAQVAFKKLVWADEFNTPGLPDSTKWGYDVGRGCPQNCGWGNNELQYYTAGDNLYMSNGNMIIEARKENRGSKTYTSTRLTTMGKKSFKFGRIDMRAKLQKGQGIWPALISWNFLDMMKSAYTPLFTTSWGIMPEILLRPC